MRREIALVLLMLLLLAGCFALFGRLAQAHNGAQTQFVSDAVKSAALTCYAVEGAYPESLQYLREHYGLAYDEDRYQVSYDAFASNLLPEIFVVEVDAP